MDSTDDDRGIWHWRVDLTGDDEPNWVVAFAGTASEVWLEVHRGAWVFAHRLVIQDGVPTLAELRIFPFERLEQGARLPGQWWKPGKETVVPVGGLAARTIREAKLGDDIFEFVQRLIEIVDEWVQDDLAAGDQAAFPLPDILMEFAKQVRRPRGGRQPLDVELLALVAVLYDGLMQEGTRHPTVPLQRLLAQHGHFASTKTIKRWVSRARDKGFLVDTVPGRASGTATQAARDLVRTTDRVADVVPIRTSKESGVPDGQ